MKHILTACRKYDLSSEYWTKERRKSQYGELRMSDILINPVSLKKAAIAMKETELIDQFRVLITEEDDWI